MGQKGSNGETGGDRPVDSDQRAAEADQTASDRNQTASDADQSASDLNQAQSDVDQAASDRDQAASDRDLGDHPGAEEQEVHDRSRDDRDESTSSRGSVSDRRAQTAADRDRRAEERDEVARRRDQTADAHDEEAEVRERAIRDQAEKAGPLGERLIAAFEGSEAARVEAAEARDRAANDRLKAAADRAQAALDRARSAGEIRRARLDDLTGVYGRDIGQRALREEVEKAQKSHHSLVLINVEVDGLKDLNEREGRPAGDALLRDLATAIQSELGDASPIVRMEGDQFVCTFPDIDLDRAHDRFAQIELALSSATSISVGFAAMRPDESFEELLGRGDSALSKAKHGG
jgi:diguanylate cyclase (GGDEF)-like protein